MKITPTTTPEPEEVVEIDDIENAKLHARDVTVSLLKKSVKWVIISFFVLIFAGCMYLWLSSFTLT